MQVLRAFLGSREGMLVSVAVLLLALGVGAYGVWDFAGVSADGVESRQRWFVCAETGKAFRVRVEIGMEVPVVLPGMEKATGYPAELCYYNADGTVKSEPTAVLVVESIGGTGPTFCGDCGRLVVGRNPAANAARPAPTREEWEARVKRNGIVASGAE